MSLLTQPAPAPALDRNSQNSREKEGPVGYQPVQEPYRTHSGHIANDDLIAVASSHRRIANPVPMAMYGFGTTLFLYSLYNLHVAGVQTPNAIVSVAICFGGFTQVLAGLWEFVSGNTFGATLFVSYGCFWWGIATLFVPFFGLTGTYDGVPNIYSPQGLGATETADAFGLYLLVWMGITLVFLFSSLRSSVAMIAFLALLTVTLGLLGGYQYMQMASLERAGGAVGCVTAFAAYWCGSSSFFTPRTTYFQLPVGDLSLKD